MEEAKWMLSEVTRGTAEEKNLTLGQMLSGDNGSAQQRVMSLLCLLSSTNKAHRCFDKYEQEEMYRRERRKRQDAERRRKERYLFSLYNSREKAKAALYQGETNSATSSPSSSYGSRLSFTSESGNNTASTAFLHLKEESTSPELTVGNSIYPSCGDTAFSFSAIPSGLGEARITSFTAMPSPQLNDLEGLSSLSSPPCKDVGSTSPTLEKNTATELAFIPTRSVWSQLTYELLKSSERKQWTSSGTANALCSCFDCACDSQPSCKTFQELPGPSTTTHYTSLWDDAGNDNRYEREFQELAEFLLT